MLKALWKKKVEVLLLSLYPSGIRTHDKIYNEIYISFLIGNPNFIKDFLWELSLGAVNTVDRLLRRMPYMKLNPSWCIMFEFMLNLEAACLCIVLLHPIIA